MEEDSVIQGVQEGNESSFKKLLDDALPRIRTLLTHQYKLQDADMDDVIQVASNKAWQKMSDFRGESKFITWFYIIVRNEVVNLVKKKNLLEKREVGANFLLEDSDDGAYDHILSQAVDKQSDDNASSILQKKEQIDSYRKLLLTVLDDLSESHRQIIEMVFEQELSYKEIAETLNIPIGTVMSRLFFARKRAQGLISKYAKKHDISLDCLGKSK